VKGKGEGGKEGNLINRLKTQKEKRKKEKGINLSFPLWWWERGRKGREISPEKKKKKKKEPNAQQVHSRPRLHWGKKKKKGGKESFSR